MIVVYDKSKCCGCTACASVCAHRAISMEHDEQGFSFPHVNLDLCTNCHLCEEVCPLQKRPETNMAKHTFVALASDHKEQMTSTSGGLASVFARYIIAQFGGVVYGCTGNDCFHVRHIRIDSIQDLPAIKGSKYVQSDLNGIFPKVKTDLKSGRYVMFIGTPCQVAGLRKYLRKSYDKLFCVDFICHGVPSQQILTSAIKEFNLDDTPHEVKFRLKEQGKPSQYCLQLTDTAGSVLYKGKYGKDCYMTGFIYALFYRDSCYQCPFASRERVGDITVGDYWNSDKEYDYLARSKDGLSQMHVNTDQGNRLYQLLSDQLRVEPISLDKLLKHSGQLSHPMPRHRNADVFWALYKNSGFNIACRKALSAEIRHLRLQPITNIVFSIPGFKPLYFLLKKKLRK